MATEKSARGAPRGQRRAGGWAVGAAVAIGAATAAVTAASEGASGAVMAGLAGVLAGSLVTPTAALSAGCGAIAVILLSGGASDTGGLVHLLAILGACGFGVAYNRAGQRVISDITRRLGRDPDCGCDTARAFEMDLKGAGKIEPGAAALALIDLPDLEAAGPQLKPRDHQRMLCELVARVAALEGVIGVYRVAAARIAILMRGEMTHDMAAVIHGSVSGDLPLGGGGAVRLRALMGWANGRIGDDSGPALARAAGAALSNATVSRVAGDEAAQGSFDMHLAARLGRALDAGELTAHHQRKINLQDGRVEGCEILLRWPDAPAGVHPGVVVGIAEQFQMTERVLEVALAGAAGASRCVPGRISVNLSGCDLRDAQSVETLFARAEAHGIAADRLEIEITETALQALTPDVVVDLLGEIRARGATVALDDFGVGESSLVHLATWPADVVKIDRAFVSDLPGDTRSAAIVAGLAATAACLGIQLVAEGVETQAQADWLRRNGVGIGQGFHFHRPAPISVSDTA